MRHPLASPTRSLPRQSRAARARRVSLEPLEGRELLAAVAPPGGLISWWTADNTGADLKGLNNSTLVSGATYAAGKVGQAFSLDGVNDRVQMADSNSLKLTQSLTIEGWVKVDSLPVQQGEILFRGDDRGGLDPYSLSLQSSGDLRFEVVGQNGAVSMSISTPMPLGQFVHSAATLDDATGAMRLYVNGVLVAQTTTTVRPFADLDPASNPGVGIGNHGGYPSTPHNFPFDGLIDELAVYNRALTEGEIQGIYNAGGDGKIKAASYFTSDLPSVTEGTADSTTAVTFTISRVGSLSGQAIVDWSTSNGTATAGTDYVAASGQLVFQNGETQKSVVITVNGDNSPESNETFNLVLSTPTPGYGVGGGQAIITDDDVAVSVEDGSVIEGDTWFGNLGALVSQTANGGLNRSTGMVFGPDGNLYVGSLNTHEVLRYSSSTGAFLGPFVTSGSGGLKTPALGGLIFRPDGKLYVASRDNNNVLRYDAATGAFLDTFIPANSGGLLAPKGMTFGPDGNVYLSSGTDEVLRYDGGTGAFLGAFVAAGSGLSNPRGLTFGPDGCLYVACTNTNSVLKFNGATGAPLGTFITSNSGGLTSPGDILFANDDLYVSSQNSNEVLRYDAATGAFLDVAVGAATSGLDRPLGLLIDDENMLLVGSFAEVLRYGPPSTDAFTVRLSFPSATTVTVDYATASGSATSGTDFTPVTGTVTFAPGQTTRTVLVPVLDDATSESSETFALNLTGAIGATIVDGQGVGTIQDDETIYQLAVTDVMVTEGDNTPHDRGPFVEGTRGQFMPITFGPDGNFYVGTTSNEIRRYNGQTGAFIDVFIPGTLIRGIRDIRFRDGYLYVGSENTDEVLRYRADTGAFDRVFVTAGSGGIDGPHGLAFGPDASGDGVPELYVTGRNSFNVVRYNGVTGSPMGTFVAPGSGGMSWPEGLTFDPAGAYLYVASAGSNQVLKFNAQTGAYVGVGASTNVAGPKDVKFGPADGLLYVASSGNDRILRFTASGTYVDDYVPAGSGGMDDTYRLAFGPDGDLYATALGSAQVMRFGTANEAIFTVTLSLPRSRAVTVQFATANGSAVAGVDYTALSGTLTYAPGATSRLVRVPILNDAAAEPTESFTLNLSAPALATIADATGVAVIADNDVTKFYVVDDASADRIYEYGAGGNSVENYAINSGNTAPRGAASTAAGDKVWVVDANKNVYVYNTSGTLLGSWAAGGLASNATVEGIATNSTDVWLVDARQDKVFKYTGAASRLSGSQNAASSFALNSGNTSPKDVVTDGTSLWVVNDSTTDKVFKYSLSGSLSGSWTISGAGSSPTGITLDPSGGGTLWLVDSGTDRVYQFDNARSRTSGSQSPATSFALAAGNTNPQGIADPPAGRVADVPRPGSPRPSLGLGFTASRGPDRNVAVGTWSDQDLTSLALDSLVSRTRRGRTSRTR